jgi:Fe-S-cluster-containing dehydrogenase component
MDVTRRTFVKAAAVASAAALVADAPRAEAAARRADNVAAMLVDTTKCVGCRACEAACSEANGLPAPAMAGDAAVLDTRRTTDPRTYTVVNRFAGPGGAKRFVKSQCMHCIDPACASACPVKALEKTPEGPVVYHKDRCIGCRYCMVACPFGVPRFEYASAAPFIQKCSFCTGRQAQGKPPACAEVCPSGALTFGTRKALLEAAKTRIWRDPETFVHEVYGEHEAGGTSWLYVSDVPFEQLGFRTDVAKSPYPELTWGSLSVVPLVMMLWPPLLMALGTFARSRGARTGGGDPS